ncbi:MAG TPA: flippase [Solirubrobacteraceae bacterium]|jgi:O-antigen/teichoic acid export membrane protein|nr:flippase [Solirubrobacteraceae bacterium]
MPSAASQATRQRAAHDVFIQIFARVLNLALGVLVTALLARTLGGARYGQWSTILVVLSLVSSLMNFGMEGVVVREASREPERELEWLGSMLTLRLLLLVPVVLIAAGAIVLLHSSQQMLLAGLILLTTMPFSGVSVLGMVFQLRVRNIVPMLVLTLRSVLWGTAVVIVYFNGGSLVELAIAMALTNAVGSLVQMYAGRRLVGQWLRPTRQHIGTLLRVGVPLGLSGVLVIFYARIDQVIVYVIAGSRSAGLYGAVYGVLDQSHFVPVSVLTTLAPIIAAAWPADRERLLRTVRLAAEFMAIASLGALAFACVASTQIVRLIFGADFLAAAPALPVLGGAFVFICFGYLNGNLLVVMGMQQRLLRISLIALLVNLIGNFILVPIMGFMGAAWMTLVTEVVVFGASLRLIDGALGLRSLGLARIARTVLAAALLGAVLGGLELAGASLAVLIVAACLCYPALLFGLRALELDDVRVLLKRKALA